MELTNQQKEQIQSARDYMDQIQICVQSPTLINNIGKYIISIGGRTC